MVKVKGLRVGSLGVWGFLRVFWGFKCYGVLGCLGVTVKGLRG